MRHAEMSFWAEPKKLCASARVGWTRATQLRTQLNLSGESSLRELNERLD